MIAVRPLEPGDRPWSDALEDDSWGPGPLARLGELVEPRGLPGFVALLDGERAGLVTYAIRADECEVTTLRSVVEGRGVGRVLMDAVRAAAEEAGCRRLWLITGNDSVRALGFYQRWGMDLCALHRDDFTRARRELKPHIPEMVDGIPLRHALELELRL